MTQLQSLFLEMKLLGFRTSFDRKGNFCGARNLNYPSRERNQIENIIQYLENKYPGIEFNGFSIGGHPKATSFEAIIFFEVKK